MSNEKHSTALGLDIPSTNGTGRMIRRPAWHYDYDFSTDENCNFAMAASVNGNVPLNYVEASPHTPTADNLQNITSPTPDSSIHFFTKTFCII